MFIFCDSNTVNRIPVLSGHCTFPSHLSSIGTQFPSSQLNSKSSQALTFRVTKLTFSVKQESPTISHTCKPKGYSVELVSAKVSFVLYRPIIHCSLIGSYCKVVSLKPRKPCLPFTKLHIQLNLVSNFEDEHRPKNHN